MALIDKIACGLEGSVEVVEPYFVELLPFFLSHDIVAESHERHTDGFHPPEQIRISRACQK
jgi:hypothetical protein